MQYRQLGTTGMRVSEIGFGAWGIGGSSWIGAQEDESLNALHHAADLGINFIDTARGYGESERIVGQLVRERAGEGLLVATKVPPKNRTWPASPGVDPMEVFPGEHIRHSIEQSLSASRLEAFDVLQFHVWSEDWVGKGDWLETVHQLKAEGKFKAFGVSINDYQPENAVELINSGVVDTVQVIYNIFHQQPGKVLLPLCLERGIGVIVRVALDEGGLTGRIGPSATFPDHDFRNKFFGGHRAAQVHEHVEQLVADLKIGEDDVAATALRFVLDSEAVSTVIVGMRSVANVARNAAVSGQPLSPAEREKLRAHAWERNFYLPA